MRRVNTIVCGKTAHMHDACRTMRVRHSRLQLHVHKMNKFKRQSGRIKGLVFLWRKDQITQERYITTTTTTNGKSSTAPDCHSYQRARENRHHTHAQHPQCCETEARGCPLQMSPSRDPRSVPLSESGGPSKDSASHPASATWYSPKGVCVVALSRLMARVDCHQRHRPHPWTRSCTMLRHVPTGRRHPLLQQQYCTAPK